MFESLLEKILQKQLGQFILGLDSKNLKLGVWSGNVVIENVSIKPEVLGMLEIPIKLKFSSIGKLSLQVPWSSLSSSPIQIQLERVFIILTSKPQDQWEFIDYNTINKKIELIENYTKALFQKFLEKEKSLESKGADKNTQAGYFEKLTMRIVDNLQISIKSLHVRFENEAEKEVSRFSWGLTLDRLEIFTTDKNWKKNFIDRTDPANQAQPMNKLLNLSFFTIYWNAQDKHLIGDKPKDEIMKTMDDMIVRDSKENKFGLQHIVEISANVKLVQKTEPQNFTMPEFKVDVDLEQIETKVKKDQLQEIIILMDFFNRYHMQLVKRRKAAVLLTEDQKIENEKKFSILYEQIQKTESKVLDILSESDKTVFQNILMSHSIEEILPWVKNIVKNIQKDQKIQSLEQQKIKENKGWFGGWWGQQKTADELITSEERENWNKLFEENFSEESLNMPSVIRPPEYVWFKLEFRMQGGSLQLSSISNNGDEEGIKMVFGPFATDVKLRDKNQEVDLTLLSFSIDMITKLKGSDKENVVNFLRKNEISVKNNENFIALKYEALPFIYPENEVQPDTHIDLIIKSVKVIFNPIAINRLTSFFDVKAENEELKDNAWKQIEKLNDATKKSFQQVMQTQTILKLNVKIESPDIIVPFKHNNNLENECWLLNLGNLSINTGFQLLDKNVKPEEKIDDIYEISLTGIKMQYFTSINFLNTYFVCPNPESLPQKNFFTPVHPFSISLTVSMLKSSLSDLVPVTHPAMSLSLTFPSLILLLPPTIFHKLTKIGSCFVIEEEVYKEKALTDKSVVISGAKKIGEVYKRSRGVHVWNKNFAILSGNYIYFFENKRDKDFKESFWIQNSVVEEKGEELGMQNAFSVQNRYGSCFLACEKPEVMKSWMEAIGKCQNDQAKKEAKKIQTKEEIVEDPLKVKMDIKVEIGSISLSLLDNDYNKWLGLTTNKLEVQMVQRPSDLDVKLSLNSIDLEDSLHNYLNPSLKKMIQVSNADQANDFLCVQINKYEKKNPNYQKIDLDVNVKIGSLHINFKPNVLLELFVFLKDEEEQEAPKKEEPKKQIARTETIQEIQTLLSSDEVTIVRANINWKSISLTMVHRKTYCSIAELRLKDSSVLFIQKVDEMSIKLDLGNLQLFDLSNYPNTLHEEKQWKNVKPFELLGVCNDAQSLMKIEFTSYAEGSAKIKNNVNSFAHIYINSIKIDLLMQPIFRILDFTLVQMLASLTNPEALDPRLKKTTQEIIDPIEILKSKSIHNILKSIDDGKIMELKIRIEKPMIFLKSPQKVEDFLCIDLGDITIESAREDVKVENRQAEENRKIKGVNKETGGELEEVKCDYFRIWMNQMKISVMKEGKVFKMSRDFHFNIEVERLLYLDEYLYCFDNLILDNSMRIKTRILPIILSMYKSDYLLIMKILFSNISFDDMMDRFYIHDYVYIPPSMQAPPAPIDFSLDMDNLTLFVMDESMSVNQINLPLTRIYIENLRLKFTRDSKRIMNISLAGQQLGGCTYSLTSDKRLSELSLFGEFLTKKEPHLISPTFDLLSLVPNLSESDFYSKAFQIENGSLIWEEPTLQIAMVMHPNGYKKINITLSDLRITIHAAVLYTLSGFAAMDDSVTPPEPIGKNLQDVHLVEEKKEEEQSVGMDISIDIKKIQMAIGAAKAKNALAIRGAIKVDFQTTPSKSLSRIQKEIEQNKDKLKETHYYELNQVMNLRLRVKGLEIFIFSTAIAGNSLSNFENVKKRSLLLPFDLEFSIKNYLAWTSKNMFYHKGMNKVEVQKTVFLISYKDISEIQKIVNNQLEGLAKVQEEEAKKIKEIKEEKPKKGFVNFKKGVKKVISDVQRKKNVKRAITIKRKEIKSEDILGSASKEGDVMNLSTTNFEIITNGLQLVFVNDAGDTFVPVLEFKIFDMKTLMIKNLVIMTISVPLRFSASYYNPKSTKWEPIIEKSDLLIDIASNALASPHFQIIINSCIKEGDEDSPASKSSPKGKQGTNEEVDNPLNINVSTQMINVLLKSLTLLSDNKTEVQKATVKHTMSIIDPMNNALLSESILDQQEQPIDNMEHVSPFTIRNETGYPVTFCRVNGEDSDSSKKFKEYHLQNGESTNLQIETTKDEMFSLDQDNASLLINNMRIDVNIFGKDAIYGKEPLSKINVDLARMRMKRYKLIKNQILHMISEVDLDKKSNRKLIVLSSPLVIYNKTIKELNVRILVDKTEFVDLSIPSGQNTAVPIDLIEKLVLFKFSENKEWSQKSYSFAKIMSSSNENSFGLELGKVNTILQIVKEAKGFGKTKVIFYPPYRIKNALPIDMMIQFISSSLPKEAKENSSKIQPQEELHEYRVGLEKTKLQFKIKLPGFWWSDESRLYSPNTEFAREVTLKDMNGQSHTISIHHIESFEGPKQFIFYTKGYLINESTYKLFFHSINEKKNSQLLAGSGRVEPLEEKNEELVFFHEQKNILVSEQEKIAKPENVSKPFSLDTIGDSAIEFQTQQGYLHLGVTAKTVCVDDENHIYTKVMSFTPRYVVENKLKNAIGIRQAGTDQNFHIEPIDREPYKWQDQTKPKKIQYTILDEPHSWNWSGEIDITALGLANFLLRSIVNPKVYKYMKADILNDNGLIYIVIDEYSHENEPYIISNELPDTRISYIQEGVTKYNLFELMPGEKAPFIWDHPSDKKIIKVQFTNLSGKYEYYHSNFAIDKIDSKVKFSINPTVVNELKLEAVAQTIIEGNSKVLIFKKSQKAEKKKKEVVEGKEGEGKLLNIEFKANLKLEHLGINIIENTGNKTIEMLYITFLGLELVVIDTKKKRTLQSKIQYFNIDNNHAYLVNYPVLFTPTFKKKCLEKQFFLNFFMEKSLKELEVNVFNSIVLDLEPMTIKVEDSLISAIIEFYSALSEILYPKDQEQTTNDTNQRYIYHLNKNKRPELWFWEKDPIQASNKLTFIDNFVISPIKLNLTFMSKSKGSELEIGFAILAMFFKAIGVALANIDDAPIKLNGIKLDNVFDTNSGITSKLISHYKQSVTTEVFKLLGSINIIGNPVGLFTQIGTGVSDLFEKPKEGFVKGPLEGGLGVVEGAGSLIKHAFAGTFNSIDKMTGSLGTGLAALSLDEEYLKEREKMKMKKAAHVGEGFKQGAISIFTGFEKGITGVFMKPIEGAKSGGVKGFFKGTLQGITGLVFKPVSGVLDATSKAAEGIKNTATTFDDKPNEKRMRLIRAFYGSEKYYKSYNPLDAYLNYLLKVELKNGRYADANYLNGYYYKENNENIYLFLTLEYIIKFNETKRKKEWDILCENIKDFEIKGKEVLIFVNSKPKKWQKEFVTVKLPEDEKMEVFYNYLKEIKEKGKEEKI